MISGVFFGCPQPDRPLPGPSQHSGKCAYNSRRRTMADNSFSAGQRYHDTYNSLLHRSLHYQAAVSQLDADVRRGYGHHRLSDVAVLLLARILQAMAAGVLMPMIQTVILLLFPREKRGAAMGAIGIVIAFAPAIGPTLSGWIVDQALNSIFLLIVPLALIIIVISFLLLKNVGETSHTKLDILSVIFSASDSEDSSMDSALPEAMDGSIHNPGLPDNRRVLPGSFYKAPAHLIGAAAGAEHSQDQRLQIFHYRQHDSQRGADSRNHHHTYISFRMSFSSPRWNQVAVMLPGSLLMGIMSPVTGRLFDKFGPRGISTFGLALLGLHRLFHVHRRNLDLYDCLSHIHRKALWSGHGQHAYQYVGAQLS